VKRLSFSLILLLAGCMSSQNEIPHSNGHSNGNGNGNGVAPPVPKFHTYAVLRSPKAAGEVQARRKTVVRSGPEITVPHWNFVRMPTNTFGNWQIEATADLNSGVWYPVAVVYGATNVVLTSDTVTKRGMLFYRVKQVK